MLTNPQTPCMSYTGRPRVHAKPIIFLHLCRRYDIKRDTLYLYPTAIYNPIINEMSREIASPLHTFFKRLKIKYWKKKNNKRNKKNTPHIQKLITTIEKLCFYILLFSFFVRDYFFTWVFNTHSTYTYTHIFDCFSVACRIFFLFFYKIATLVRLSSTSSKISRISNFTWSDETSRK